MLTLDECRNRLTAHQLSDEQLAEIRDALNAFALVLVEEYCRGELASPTPQHDEDSEPC